MKLDGQHIQVLIVGAGPSGLMMAAQLIRYGIQPIIIDSNLGPTEHSKALAVQARSLEIYRQMGLVDRILREAKTAKGLVFHNGGHKVAELSFDDVGNAETMYPSVYMYPQSKNERLLLDYLTENCCPVYWNTSITQLDQGIDSVKILLSSDGQMSNLTCYWLIGADGAHSAVRKQLGIAFKGDTYNSNFYLADLELANKEFNDGHVQLFLDKQGFAGFFPMPEDNRYRIVGNLPAQFNNKTDLKIGDIEPYLNDVVNETVMVIKNHWFTTYRLHHRMAEKFRDRRCFLVGDAAHIHSPVGGQGMNTGLQDAYNLAWKLAGVVSGRFNTAILDSYAVECMPVAKDLLSTTDRVFTIVMSQNWLTSIFKKWALPGLLKLVWSKRSFRTMFFKRLSQIGITYRDSNINLHLSQSAKIKAGDRLPYHKVFDEKRQVETDLHEWCSKPGFTLILMGNVSEDELFRIARWITQKYPKHLNLYYLPPSNKNRLLFNAFEVSAWQNKTLIIRPDMHIGLINDGSDIKTIDNYLSNILGWKL